MARRYAGIVAVVLGVAAFGTAGPAAAAQVAVVVVPRLSIRDFAERGAVGLVVPGSGDTVSRASALAALETGKVRHSLLGGIPTGRRLIHVSRRPSAITIYVTLPPRGRHPNTVRYPIAVVGGGYHGLLFSPTTRIDGLVGIVDVAPTVLALERRGTPRLRHRADADAARTLAHLDARLEEAHDARSAAAVVLGTTAVGFAVLGALLRRPAVVRAGLLGAPVALVAALLLSSVDVYSTLPLALVTVGVTLALALYRRALVPALLAVLVAYLVVLAGWTEVNSLSALGPHPDAGARYYGLNNQVETLLLVPLLVPVAVLGLRALLPVGVLGLAVVALSRTGADGGGAVVFVAALAALAARLRPAIFTVRRSAALAAAGILLLLALVAVDAAAGGRSHVTDALAGGPGEVFHDFTRRVHLSYLLATSSWHSAATVLAAAGCLVAGALLLPRFPVGEALLVALVCSLLVNDTPTDVLGYGAGAYVVVWTWERTRSAGIDC